MTQELIYTSAPKGLRLGSRGFCTVACTPGMAKPLADRLEALSGYKHLFPPGSAQAALNPVNYSFVTFKLGGTTYYVLSRIADAGLDYTQRTNKLAHHVVLEASELPAAGPAWLMSQPGFFETHWVGEPRILTSRKLPPGQDKVAVCHTWEEIAGDAGWAGVLSESLGAQPQNEAFIIYRPGAEVLRLVVEAESLLPARKRWAATFSTYHSQLPPGVVCSWKFLPDGATEALKARRSPGTLVLDLTTKRRCQTDGRLIDAARTGEARLTIDAPNDIALAPKSSPHQVFSAAPKLPSDPSGLDLDLQALPPQLPARAPQIPSDSRQSPTARHRWSLVACLIIVAIGGAFLGGVVLLALQVGSPTSESNSVQQRPSAIVEDVAESQTPYRAEPPKKNLSPKPETKPADAFRVKNAKEQAPPPVPANGESAKPEKTGVVSSSDRHVAPKVNDFLKHLKPTVGLPPYNINSIATVRAKPDSLGTFPTKAPKLKVELCGLATPSRISIKESSPGSQWTFTAGPDDIARLTFASLPTPENPDQCELVFSWLDGARRSQAHASELSFSGVVLSDEELDTSAICVFEPADTPDNIDPSPITLSELVNRVNAISNELRRVPSYQELSVLCKLEAPGLSSPAVHSIALDVPGVTPQPTEISFGPSKRWVLRISLAQSSLELPPELSIRTAVANSKIKDFDKAIRAEVFHMKKAAEATLVDALRTAKLIEKRLRPAGGPSALDLSTESRTSAPEYRELRQRWRTAMALFPATDAGIVAELKRPEPLIEFEQWIGFLTELEPRVVDIDLWEEYAQQLNNKFRLHVTITRTLANPNGQPLPVEVAKMGSW